MNRRSVLRYAFLGVVAGGFGVNLLAKDSIESKSQKKDSKNIESNSQNSKADSKIDSKPKVAVLAASGKAGFLILKECVNAGFSVTAIVRNAKKLQDLAKKNKLDSKKFSVKQKDIFALDSKDLSGFDSIVDAFGEVKDPSLFVKHIQHLHDILKGNPARLIIVGGAGSLYLDKSHTKQLFDTPDFPKEYLPVAKAHGEVLDFLRAQDSKAGAINWVYVSPPADFRFDGVKSGKYKIIGEEFETNSKGESAGSYADYALAIVDIIKDSKINKQRVGVIGL
ncbi:NAD(P)H-binding protein [Helicobacter saguini]|uniref:NAD(P)-dependent oxidoreductase n=1 Tax=Helicobacter saguini TaxID=1548018 RepID=A0A347W4L0_9HELI|nr:NAD(P)H-binding protein [Helicobacter saguini]MWV61806.1 NAD(P)H-binding protein [Helicobacter saguini]MWV67519.1 NAD(P)H-binding protein [Helicobacter saguini]MWV69870.1 NAD(P)H-binding protein [Helicobacter saguini]MWV72912.1 NAD(P)H-binding protein [Helicobacter saguini]TLD93264.1 NAD(P)-dependent oxidoreductase [Helicobacter saguini]